MMSLPQKTLNYLRRAHVRLTALIGLVLSFIGDEQSSQSDWDACTPLGTPGVDFPATTMDGGITAGTSVVTVVTTDGFTVGSPEGFGVPGYLIFYDGVDTEVVSYTSSTGTTFTGLERGQYGTTAQSWNDGDSVWQLIFSHGSAIDFNLEIQPKNWVLQHVTAGGPPSARRGCKIIYRPVDGCFYMFGGYDGAAHLNDLWKFDPGPRTWTDITPGAPNPDPRQVHHMIYSIVEDEIWMCGGDDPGPVEFDDLWKYDFGGAAWSTNAAWDMPNPFRGGMACYFEDGPGNSRMFITGGKAGTTDYSRTFMFTGSGWTALGFLPDAPYRWSHGDACWMEKEGIILVIGDGNEVAYLDITTWRWTITPMPSNARWHSSLNYDDVNNVALLFGGAIFFDGDGQSWLSEYRRDTNEWTELDIFSREGRVRHDAAWNSDDKYLFVWGGQISLGPDVWPAYTDPMTFEYYWPSVKVRTQNLDMGKTPSFAGEMRLEDIFSTVDNLTGIEYDADWSDDAAVWNNLGISHDGDEVTELHRYWRFDITLTNSSLNRTPAVTTINVVYDVVGYIGMANHPVDSHNQYPPIVKKISIGPSKIDILRNSASIGSAKFDMLNDTRTVENTIKENYPRNNTLYIQIGFAEKDFLFHEYILAFKSRVEDWDYDGRMITAKTRDFLADLEVDVPVESAAGIFDPLVYDKNNIFAPVDIMLDIIQNHVNIPDRDLDLASFDEVAADPSIEDWAFKRTISSPENARKLCLEICRHIGAVLIPREDGRLALKLIDPTADADDTWDERNHNFRNVKFFAKASDSIRNYISTWWEWDGSGDESDDYGGAEVSINAPSIANWGRKVFRTKSKWIGGFIPPYFGNDVARAISDRQLALAKNGIPKITLETNMTAYPVQVGDIVRIRSSVVLANDEYLEWQRKYDPVKELKFIDKSGRYSIPYVVFGTSECIDMKWFITRKQLDIGRATIKWELSRAREVPLTQQFTSQADFAKGAGNLVDLENTPGTVEIALASIFQTIEDCETAGTFTRLGDTSATTLDGVNFVEGSNSLDMGKPNGSHTFAIYYKAVTAFDGENSSYFAWVYIAPAALALLKSTGTALTFIASDGIAITNYYYRDYTQAELTAGLSGGIIKLGGILPDDFNINNSPDINELDAIYIRFNTDLAGDVIPHADLGVDWFHLYFGPALYVLIIDMTQQPEQPGMWTLDITEPADTSITFEAWASETGFFKGEEISLGAVVDTDAITIKTRFYKIMATMTPDDLYATTPSINEITATFADG